MYCAALQTWNDAARLAWQAQQFDKLTATLRADNAFYRDAWRGLDAARIDFAHLDELPLTTKRALLDDQAAHPPFGHILTYPVSRYARFHQTSGTTGVPLRVLDTAESWTWFADGWRFVLDAAGVTSEDIVLMAFSFGPFIGFWSAHQAAEDLGALIVAGGGMNTDQRLKLMQDVGATVLLCTPSYALHLGQAARERGLHPARDIPVRITIHAGEPGAGIPATRARIEELWGAACFDHAGATEIGAWGFSCTARNGLHVNEAQFIVEILDPQTGRPVPAGQEGELVLTNLGRTAYPVIRYRTGDVVQSRPRGTCACGRTSIVLDGGVRGRIDDMVCIRGVNVFPAAFLSIFNHLPGTGEHRVTAYRAGAMDELHVEFEADGADRRRDVQQAIRETLGIRVSLAQCPPATLPTFEMKAKRFFDRRAEGWQPATPLKAQGG